VCGRCLDPSDLAFSFSLYWHPSICILFSSRFTSYKQNSHFLFLPHAETRPDDLRVTVYRPHCGCVRRHCHWTVPNTYQRPRVWYVTRVFAYNRWSLRVRLSRYSDAKKSVVSPCTFITRLLWKSSTRNMSYMEVKYPILSNWVLSMYYTTHNTMFKREEFIDVSSNQTIAFATFHTGDRSRWTSLPSPVWTSFKVLSCPTTDTWSPLRCLRQKW
jgi:hypothetical protein